MPRKPCAKGSRFQVMPTQGRLHRLGETGRSRVEIRVDGHSVSALEGDSLLTAVLSAGRVLRLSEFGDGARAGFCLMGACQDCWMWSADGGRLRACSTPVAAGMDVVTKPVGDAVWPRAE